MMGLLCPLPYAFIHMLDGYFHHRNAQVVMQRGVSYRTGCVGYKARYMVLSPVCGWWDCPVHKNNRYWVSKESNKFELVNRKGIEVFKTGDEVGKHPVSYVWWVIIAASLLPMPSIVTDSIQVTEAYIFTGGIHNLKTFISLANLDLCAESEWFKYIIFNGYQYSFF